MKVAWLYLLFLLVRSKTQRKEVWLCDRKPCALSYIGSLLWVSHSPFFFFFLRTSETILPLLCMANSSSDLQACHLMPVWDHPREISKQQYLSLSLLFLHPTLLLVSSAAIKFGCWAAGAQEFPLLSASPSTFHKADRGIFHLLTFLFPLWLTLDQMASPQSLSMHLTDRSLW